MARDNWNCVWRGTHIDVLYHNGTSSQQVGIYNILTGQICVKCGNPYIIQLDGNHIFCNESYLHERLIYADGLYQVGHYFDREWFSERIKNDLMNQHIWNLKRDSEYAIPLGKAMFLMVKNHFPILSNADTIVPMPNYMEDPKLNLKAEGLAKEFLHSYEAGGYKAELIEPLKKVKNISTRRLSRNDREEAVKTMYEFNNDISVRGKKIILIDDVLAAGNNKGECVKILREHGASKIWVFVAGRNK